MQANSDPYLLGTSAVPLMSAAEEISRALTIRELRVQLWQTLLTLETAPRVILDVLRDREPDAAQTLQHRLLRLGRHDGQGGGRAMAGMVSSMVELDRGGELSGLVLRALRPLSLSALGRSQQLHRAWRREKDRFVLANMGLVFKVAGRFRNTSLSLHDLVQDGALGLMRAVDMFDPDRGFRFSTYAVWWIRHSMGRALADRSRTIRVPVHLITLQAKLRKERPKLTESLGREPSHAELADVCGVTEERVSLAEQAFLTSVVSLDQPRVEGQETLDIPDHDDPREALEFHLSARSLETVFGGLDRMEADIVRKRFGLEHSPMTLQEIGREYALSRERIRQIELRALAKMRASLRNDAASATGT